MRYDNKPLSYPHLNNPILIQSLNPCPVSNRNRCIVGEAEAIVRNLAAESGVSVSMPYYDRLGILGSEKESPGGRSCNSSINSLNNLAALSSTTFTNKNYYDTVTSEKALIDQLTQLPIDTEEEQEATILDLFRTPHMRRITIALLIIWFSFGFTYYGIIILVTRIYTTGYVPQSHIHTHIP